MKIATWNCNMAFLPKGRLLKTYSPDLAIIPECECPEKLQESMLLERDNHIWVGDNPNKGLGIFLFSNATLSIHPLYDTTIQYAVPIIVNGVHPFVLLAIWAMDNKQDHLARYIDRVWLAIHKYAELLRGSALIAGDFNWNSIWDRDRQSLYGNLTQVITVLGEKHIHSLYHHHFGEAFGKETQPTLYMYRNAQKPYHIDYIFGSQDFVHSLKMLTVGTYQEWSAYSDHVPVIADFVS